MNKKIENKNFDVTRKVESVDVGFGVSIYKDSIYINGILFSEKEGITETKNLNVSTLENINFDEHYYAINKEFLTLWQTEYCELFKYISKNPYTTYTSASNDYIIVLHNCYTDDLLTLDRNPYPKAMNFGYLNGSIDDENFCLEELYNFLIQYPEKFKNVVRKDIPYYNADEFHTEQIAFTWIPSQEEYALYINQQISNYDILRSYAITLMGLDQFRKK